MMLTRQNVAGIHGLGAAFTLPLSWLVTGGLWGGQTLVYPIKHRDVSYIPSSLFLRNLISKQVLNAVGFRCLNFTIFLVIFADKFCKNYRPAMWSLRVPGISHFLLLLLC